jgi:hypothetical protein
LQNLINAAQFQVGAVAIPTGTCDISAPLNLPAVAMQGAGVWHTTIHQRSDTSDAAVYGNGGNSVHARIFNSFNFILTTGTWALQTAAGIGRQQQRHLCGGHGARRLEQCGWIELREAERPFGR